VSATTAYPRIIQGGMGVGVSSWRLANAVSRAGQLGVVSGSMLDTVMVRRLQDGDPGGHIRRAANRFPIPGVADRVIERYYRPSGRPPGTAYQLLPMYRRWVSPARQRVTMLANFVEVWLAKEGHSGAVGINLLTKVQLPNLASIYGAMLAGVDYVIMGAGIPREIPAVLDAFAEHRPARLRFDIQLDAESDQSDSVEYLELDPAEHWSPDIPLERPRFLGVISAASLAATLARKATGVVDGFVVEGPTAGGHNAPPRGQMRINENGEPLYGERDVVKLAEMRAIGAPFWLAGGMGSPEALGYALSEGAAGIQVGTLFAYADESGIAEPIKQQVLRSVRSGTVAVKTDPRASPTGFPFKVVSFGDVVGTPVPERARHCDLGYLRVAARTAKGFVYRCAAEPVADFVAKGGDPEETVGRQCLCNGLTATIGLAQSRGHGVEEPPLITSGDALLSLDRFLGDRLAYSATDVLDYLLAPPN
jgi:NAD(P)H-dependent flavin oxidoreductase YrpB (nitropropane dioxygenase family)